MATPQNDLRLIYVDIRRNYPISLDSKRALSDLRRFSLAMHGAIFIVKLRGLKTSTVASRFGQASEG